MGENEGHSVRLASTVGKIENLSKVAADVLVSGAFEPYAVGYLVPSHLGDELVCATETAAEYLEELAHPGFIARAKGKFPTDEPHYQPTLSGCFAAEVLRRRRRMRQPALINQQSYKLEDLILAIAFVPRSFNDNLPGGALGMENKVPAHWLQIYLGERKIDDICAVINELADARFLVGTVRIADGVLVGKVELSPRGYRRYVETVRQQFGLAANECILDPPPNTLKVFFAWQSEMKKARNVLWELVPEVIKDLNSNAGLLRQIELVIAKEPGEGAIRLDATIQEKIRLSDYFIGDLTPVYAYHDRLRVNENVLVETGFALASKPPNKIILMEMTGIDVPGDNSKNPQLAFDIKTIHRLTFPDKKEARKRLLGELVAMLKTDGWIGQT